MILEGPHPAPKPVTTAPCPKCGTAMVLAAITPHPLVPQMKRHTFLCAKCNQTKTYMLKAGDETKQNATLKSQDASSEKSQDASSDVVQIAFRPMVDGGLAVGASSLSRHGSPRSLSCATAWSATA